MCISSRPPYGNTSPGGVTPSTLSCHSTLSMRQRSQIYRGGDACSRPATASHLTIIGRALVEKVLRVIEVSPEPKRRRSAKPRQEEKEAERGPRKKKKKKKSFVRYTEVRSPRQRGKTVFWAHEAEKGSSLGSGPLKPINLQVKRNMIQGSRSLPFISLCEEP